MNTYSEELPNTAYNPFPEPQTIPSGWDLSGIVSTSQETVILTKEDSAEG